MTSSTAPQLDRQLDRRAHDDWLSAGIERLANTRLLALTPATGGGNNRVYRADLAGDWTVAVKCYPSQATDPRDRLGTEYGALSFMANHGLGLLVPMPVAADPEDGVALYEWIDGTPVGGPDHRRPQDIEDMLALLRTLHDNREADGGMAQPAASEACFSGADVVDQICSRRIRLQQVADQHADLRAFLVRAFDPLLLRARDRALGAYDAGDLQFEQPLPNRRCTLSPSDFGFHNAVRRPDGGLTFIDFEYFGWDDPVKLTADTFWHPGRPMTAGERCQFADGVGAIYGDDLDFGRRLTALFPLFGLRWCLIMLNEFLPDCWARRAYSGAGSGAGAGDRAAAQARQLDKAHRTLQAAAAAVARKA